MVKLNDSAVAALDFQADRPRRMQSPAAGPDGVWQLWESRQGGKITCSDAHPHSNFRPDQHVQPGSYFSRQFFDVRQRVRRWHNKRLGRPVQRPLPKLSVRVFRQTVRMEETNAAVVSLGRFAQQFRMADRGNGRPQQRPGKFQTGVEEAVRNARRTGEFFKPASITNARCSDVALTGG
tara:strand:- start:59 stop:595 length:537 start_codon:yes stop_codon:yes gene_type:complete